MGNVVGAILTDMGAGGVRIPGNGFNFASDVNGMPVLPGFDIFGNPISIGEATLNLALLPNGFQLQTDIQDFAQPPGGLFQLDFGTVDALIAPIETKFSTRGF